MLKNNSPKAEPVVMYRQATAFVIVTFGLSLAVWIPVIASYRGWISVEIPAGLATLGIFAPAIAAILLRYATASRNGLRSFWTAVSRWRIGRRWWVVTLLVPPVFIGGVYAAYLLFGGDIQMSTTFTMLRDAGPLAIIIVPVMVLVTIVLSFGEEAGWRGYLLPLLQSRLSALSASLVVGVVWFLWHIPLLYLPGQQIGGEAFPIVLFGATVILSSVLYTWLYNNTRRSVLTVTLLHAGLNIWGPLVALHPAETGEVLSAYMLTAGWVIVAVTLVMVFGGKLITRPEHLPTHSAE